MTDPMYLGKQTAFVGLDPIPLNNPPTRITFNGDELYCHCPVTGQPDFYNWGITFVPNQHTIESKSLKLLLVSLADEAMFAEDLPKFLLDQVVECCRPWTCSVQVQQKSRGGISIIAEATYEHPQVTNGQDTNNWRQ